MSHFYSKYLVEQPKFRTCFADHSVHALFNNCRMTVCLHLPNIKGKQKARKCFWNPGTSSCRANAMSIMQAA